MANNAVIDTGLVGPLRVTAPLALTAADGHGLINADGFPVHGLIDPDTDFYLRPAPVHRLRR